MSRTHARLLAWISAALGLALAALPAGAAVLFSDGFESGNASAWTWAGHSGAGISQSGCLEGSWCGSQTLQADQCDQSVFWSKDVAYSGQEFYVKASWRFPTSYSFSQSNACSQSNDHKAIILETENRQNRCFLNFRDSQSVSSDGSKARVAFICEGTSENFWTYADSAVAENDGQWHSYELHVSRVPGGGHVRVWQDGVLVIDEDRIICSGDCPTLREIKIGAYTNYPPTQTQTFFVDDVTMATTPIGGGAPPPPDPPLSQTPFPGSPLPIPGRVEIEDFDAGGEGGHPPPGFEHVSSWHDWTPGNGLGAYRTDVDVDIETTSDPQDPGGFSLDSVGANEWVEHTVSVDATGGYDVVIRFASLADAKTLRLELDGTDRTGSIVLPDTGGQDSWDTLVVEDVALDAGQHVLRTVFETGDTNLNWIEFLPASGPPPGQPGRPDYDLD